MAELHIGTSGWHYKHWIGNFYPERCPAGRMIEYYARSFDAVELNNTFYKLPTVNALRAWHDATPPNFYFAVKASRFITHNKKLKDPENALDNLLPRIIEGLGHKLGPVLFQTAPAWTINLERLQLFLDALPRSSGPPPRPGSVHDGVPLRYAFEFRHPSWHVDAVYEILHHFNAAFCIFDIGGFHAPLEVTADWAYMRLHGPGEKYEGSYAQPTLRRWARRIEDWRSLRQIEVYFDNDQAGYAAANALALKRMLARHVRAAA